MQITEQQLSLFDMSSGAEPALSLIDKIMAVPVKTENQIDKPDQYYCQSLQTQKDNALSVLLKAKKFYKTSNLKNDLFNVEIIIEQIEKNIIRVKKLFKDKIERYFENKYQVCLDLSSLDDHCETADLQWSDIVDCIIEQLEGLTFSERNEQEIKDRCRRAIGKYTIESAVLKGKRLSLNLLYIDDSYSNELYINYRSLEELRQVFAGLCHFDSGAKEIYQFFVNGFSSGYVKEYQWIKKHDLSFTRKLESMRFYKNGRVDFTFTSSENALLFAVEYCGYQPKA